MDTVKNIINANYNTKANDNGLDISAGDKIEADKVDRLADALVMKFDAPDSRPFYCKVAWNLAEHVIWRIAEYALEKGREPGRLFNSLIQREMDKLPKLRAGGSRYNSSEEAGNDSIR